MKMLDKSELEDILKKDGKAELVCEFCKNKYLINYCLLYTSDAADDC